MGAYTIIFSYLKLDAVVYFHTKLMKSELARVRSSSAFYNPPTSNINLLMSRLSSYFYGSLS